MPRRRPSDEVVTMPARVSDVVPSNWDCRALEHAVAKERYVAIRMSDRIEELIHATRRMFDPLRCTSIDRLQPGGTFQESPCQVALVHRRSLEVFATRKELLV